MPLTKKERISSTQPLRTHAKYKPKGSTINREGIFSRDAHVTEMGGKSEFCKSATHKKPRPAISLLVEIERCVAILAQGKDGMSWPLMHLGVVQGNNQGKKDKKIG